MKILSSLFFASLLLSTSALAAPISRTYSCDAHDIQLNLTHDLIDQTFDLDIETSERGFADSRYRIEVELEPVHVKEHDTCLEVSVLSSRGACFLKLYKPFGAASFTSELGEIVYEDVSKTTLVFYDNESLSSHALECKVYEHDESYLDDLFDIDIGF